jgi:MiaB/RimO family radical SAM methylthiotransferase
MESFFIDVSAVGCSRRKLDATRIKNYLILNGLTEVKEIENSDLVVIVTCAGFKEMIDLGLKEIKEKISDEKRIIIYGCLPAIVPKEVNKIKEEDVIITNQFEEFDKLFPDFKIKFDQVDDVNELYNTDEIPSLRTSWGCNWKCAYCSIRHAVGPLKSKPIPKIIEEYKSLIKAGFKEIKIDGNQVGAYGRDIESSFSELLTELDKNTLEDVKWDIHFIAPTYCYMYKDKIVEMIKKNRLTRIQMSVQSGSEEILKKMHRLSDIEKIEQTINDFRSCSDEVKLVTEIIVGFPGENLETINDTINLILKFDIVKIYYYTDLPKAESFSMEPKVSEQMKKAYGKIIIDKLIKNGYKISLGDGSTFAIKKIYKEKQVL